MSSDFGYINARVRGMKAKLLESEFYTQALGDSDFRAFVGTIAQTPYTNELEEAQSRDSGLTALDRAVAENFRRAARSILGFSDGRPHELIALLLIGYDLMNLKTLARAKHAGREGEGVSSALLPAGELKPALVETMAASADLPAMAQVLAVTGHPLSRAFGRAVRRYASSGRLFEFELTLDRAYFSTLLDAMEALDAPKELIRYVRRQIDAANLSTALKVRGKAATGEDLYLPGGREVDRSTFDAIVADSTQGALANLSGTGFADVANTSTLAEADRVIRRVLDQGAHRLSLRDPLGPGVVVDFLRRKEAESARLRLLARGKFYDVPREQLEKELGHA
ncbi:MAG: V-type ATPase subunit [Trueperaceae bacterium]